MEASNSELHAAAPLFEIKGGAINLPILKLFNGNADALSEAFRSKVEQAPDFFRHAPILIDLGDLADPEVPIDFTKLAAVLRDCGLVPVGVRGGTDDHQLGARAAELAVFSESRESAAHASVAKAPVKAAATGRDEKEDKAEAVAEVASANAKLITQPIRSGQRIYAPGTDLIVLAQVSAGAEIMADGNIHVYGTLRGRALAGVKGNLDARIFCMDLQAELIAIGGHYKVSENLDDSVRGRPVQIRLEDNALIIDDL